jgi:hypothetical protein
MMPSPRCVIWVQICLGSSNGAGEGCRGSSAEEGTIPAPPGWSLGPRPPRDFSARAMCAASRARPAIAASSRTSLFGSARPAAAGSADRGPTFFPRPVAGSSPRAVATASKARPARPIGQVLKKPWRAARRRGPGTPSPWASHYRQRALSCPLIEYVPMFGALAGVERAERPRAGRGPNSVAPRVHDRCDPRGRPLTCDDLRAGREPRRRLPHPLPTGDIPENCREPSHFPRKSRRAEIICRPAARALTIGGTHRLTPSPAAGGAPVSSAESVTTWVEQLRAGTRAAAHRLWERYFPCPPSQKSCRS